MIINTVDELIEYVQAQPNGHINIFIVKKEEVYAYIKDDEAKTETLETFAEPSFNEGYWMGIPVWLNALCIKLAPQLPIGPYSGKDLDMELLRQALPDILQGNLSPKQVRDLLGITDSSNQEIAEQKETDFDEMIRLLQQEEEDKRNGLL